MFPLSRREIGVSKQFGKAEHIVEGRADFIAHHGEELAFCQSGGLGGFLFPDEGFLACFAGGDIEGRACVAFKCSFAVEDGEPIRADPDRTFVLADYSIFEVPEGLCGIENIPGPECDMDVLGGIDEFKGIAPDRLRGRVSQDVRDTVREKGKLPRSIDLLDLVRCRIRNVARAFFRLGQPGECSGESCVCTENQEPHQRGHHAVNCNDRRKYIAVWQ